MKRAIYLGIAIFFATIVASFYGMLSFAMFDLFRVLIFIISITYFIWHYRITKSHVPSYERVSEGAVLCAVIFNPFYPFELDLAVWIFLEAIFMWVYMLFISRIGLIEQNMKEKNLHWFELE